MPAKLTTLLAALLERRPERAGLKETLRLEPSSTYTVGLQAKALPWEGEKGRRREDIGRPHTVASELNITCWSASWCIVDLRAATLGEQGMPSRSLCALCRQLRTAWGPRMSGSLVKK